MHYFSTRGNSPPQTFTQIVLSGLAPDGGLYLPQSYPQIDSATLSQWQNLSYAELAFEIMRLFADDIPEADLRALVNQTYNAQVFCNAPTDTAQITPVRHLGREAQSDIYLLELSNGPTLAFKDIALQFLGRLFEYVLERNHQQLNILGATSGDTGSAAEYAVRGKKNIRIFMLSPHQKMSPFQAAQMFSLQDDNVFNWTVPGFFDDCQNLVKAVSNDLQFKEQHAIGTVNSINWARVLAQVVYYFYAYLRVAQKIGAPVSFAVPSGNFGNICAGHIARMMGLPIAQLVLASNENNVLDEFFRTGVYRVRAQAQETSSPSMDISKASNFERFVFDLLGRDGERLRNLFTKVDQQGEFDLSGGAKSDGTEFAKVAQYGFVSGHSTHADRIATIKDAYAQYQRVLDPHTADALKVARNYLQADVPMIVLETARPAKFNAAIREALNIEAPRPDAFIGIENLPQRSSLLNNDIAQLKAAIQKVVKP